MACLLSQLILYKHHLGQTTYLSNFHLPNATIWQRVNVAFVHLMLISVRPPLLHSLDKKENFWRASESRISFQILQSFSGNRMAYPNGWTL